MICIHTLLRCSRSRHHSYESFRTLYSVTLTLLCTTWWWPPQRPKHVVASYLHHIVVFDYLIPLFIYCIRQNPTALLRDVTPLKLRHCIITPQHNQSHLCDVILCHDKDGQSSTLLILLPCFYFLPQWHSPHRCVHPVSCRSLAVYLLRTLADISISEA